MLIRVLVCSLMGGARLGELAWSRHNMRQSGPTTEGPRSRATYPLIVAVHTVAIVGTAVFGGQPRPKWLWLLAAVQFLRAWVLWTLGERWNARAAVPTAMSVATGGPYRWLRHPNYSVIALELLALPLAFGAGRLAFATTLANAALLSARIPEEEAALEALPGYRDHFSTRKRFVPFLW